MSVEIEESGPVERRLRVEVSIAEVDAAFDRAYRRLQQRARVSGFRPGKTPRSVLERYFGEEAQGEVLDAIVRESLVKALEESELPVIGEPQLDPEGLPKQGCAFVYSATVEIRPEITLQTVRGLQIAAPRLPEPEQDPVEAHLEELRLAHATLLDCDEGTEAARGHVAILHFEGSIDGEPFEGGQGRDMELEIGSNQSLPGFEDALVGMRAGEERAFDLDLPEDVRNEDLAGKRVHFEVELAGLKRRELAELDDEFAKDVSDFDSLQAFRDDLSARVEARRQSERTRLLRDAVIDAAIAANPFPVPPSLVERRLSARVSRALQQLRGRVPDETLRPMVEGWTEEWRPLAERDVRLAFLVGEIARSEDLSVSDEDYEAHLSTLAEASGRPLGAVAKEYREAGIAEAVKNQLLEERVLELLEREAAITEG